MNKRSALVTFIASCMFLFFSCKNTNSPQAVTEKFLISFAQMDYVTAKSLSTKNTWSLLDIWASFAKDVPDEMKKDKAATFKIKITDVKKETDSTMVVTYETDPKFLPFNKLRLLKVKDGEDKERWKVDISTIDLIGGDELYIETETKSVEEDGQNADSTAVPEEGQKDSVSVQKKTMSKPKK